MYFYISSLQYAKDNNCNYAYDQEGRLTQDLQEEIASIEWRVDGKVKRINRPSGSAKQNLSFEYDAMGHRIAKHVYTSANVLEKSTYYVLDAQGNTMATYERSIDNGQTSLTFAQTEKFIYGSSRLGVQNCSTNLLGSAGTTTYVQTTFPHRIGQKGYELSNHLGNVLSVISDKAIPHNNGGGVVDYFLADIRQAQDFSPFGVLLQNRNLSLSGAIPYRYGFNGMSKDDELKGDGNSYDFGARMLDTRLGRWLTIDPLSSKYPDLSTYCFVGNSPLVAIDPNGKEIRIYYLNEKGESTFYIYGTGLAVPDNEFVQKTIEALNFIKSDAPRARFVNDLASSTDNVLNLKETYSAEEFGFVPNYTDMTGNSVIGKNVPISEIKLGESNLYFNPYISISFKNLGETENKTISPATALFHELGHAWMLSFRIQQGYKQTITEDIQYDTKAEKTAIELFENRMAEKEGEGIRTSHTGITIYTFNPTSNQERFTVSESEKNFTGIESSETYGL